jgi:hypothetical protein
LGTGYLFWHPSFFFFFVFSSCSLWSTHTKKPKHRHTYMGLFYIGTLALYIPGIMRLKLKEEGDILLLVLLLHRLFSTFLKKKIFPTHTRPPGRQVDI